MMDAIRDRRPTKADVMEELAPTRLFRIVKEVKIPIQEKPIRHIHWFVTRDAADQYCAEAKAKGQIVLSIAHYQLKGAKANQYGLSDESLG